ncbi:MAG: phytanoyl-CoA dioxygenase family protein [Gammaproteobacteria bacterium]|nr:phytanoyl-CoA dioxygenase family protein [Gammaproteobacteria bacterium]MDH3859232.1 phytanoyl-CoA dioxygenase family protein [Gammaproteobacteria bacterium]
MIEISNAERDSFGSDGFLIVDRLIDSTIVPGLHQAFTDLFSGKFETGVRPDEVNWQEATGDPALSRQICNGWKANREIAQVVLDQVLGEAIAKLAGWPGVRIMIDNVVWKPPATKSFGFHQDSAYLSWFTPSDLLTCWIALDDTHADSGTIEFVRGSHKWHLSEPEGEFHAPEDYRKPMREAAAREGTEPEIVYVEVKAGGGSFHHGWTWHGSGANRSPNPRRSLVLHAMRSDVEYMPENFGQGIGPIYSRYKRLGDNQLDENYFPVLWREDGYRTPQIEDYLADHR